MMWLLPVVYVAYALEQRNQGPVQVDMVAGGDTSCYQESDKGKTYKGLVDITANGEKCEDYCRNEDGSEPKPWCHPVNDPKSKAPCSIPVCTAEGPFARDFADEATTLSTEISAPKDCECADELYGSTTTTANTRVGFLQGSKKPCDCTNLLQASKKPCDCTNLLLKDSKKPCDCTNLLLKDSKKPCDCTNLKDSKEPCDCTNLLLKDSKKPCDCTNLKDSKEPCDCTNLLLKDSKKPCDCTNLKDSKTPCDCTNLLLKDSKTPCDCTNLKDSKEPCDCTNLLKDSKKPCGCTNLLQKLYGKGPCDCTR